MKLPLRHPENRATYRVQIDESQASLWVGLKSGPTKAILEDLSSRGCGFLLLAEDAEGLEEGSDLVLRMKVGGPKAPQLFIRAEVRSARALDEHIQFGTVFKDAQRLYQQLSEAQWRFFNRRGAFRVAPANHRGDPLRASFFDKGSAEPVRLTVNDLSSTGLAVRLSPGRDYELSESQPVRVQFELPGEHGEFDLQVRFVHRSFVKGVERIGFNMDLAATEQGEEQSERILRYVMERQSQLLRG